MLQPKSFPIALGEGMRGNPGIIRKSEIRTTQGFRLAKGYPEPFGMKRDVVGSVWCGRVEIRCP